MGYGTLSEVSEMTAREVVQAIHYETFLAEYETAYLEMNKQ